MSEGQSWARETWPGVALGDAYEWSGEGGALADLCRMEGRTLFGEKTVHERDLVLWNESEA